MKLITAIALPAFLMMGSTTLSSATVPHLSTSAETTVAASKISYGRGLDLIVKGLGLNIDNIRFVKAPKASDYFTSANNKAAYAPSLIIAANNGIQLKKTINPEWAMTREQFALALHQAIQNTGQYITNMMWINISDASAFSEGTLSAVQNLMKFNVVTLQSGKFRPKAYITPAEASAMVKKAAAFIKKSKAAQQPSTDEEVTFSTTAVDQEINRIVLSRGSKPNSGYQIRISRIVFSEKMEATIFYTLKDPEAGNSYMQVITEPKAETFISSAYKIILKKDSVK